jgi:hypothetical protein
MTPAEINAIYNSMLGHSHHSGLQAVFDAGVAEGRASTAPPEPTALELAAAARAAGIVGPLVDIKTVPSEPGLAPGMAAANDNE